MYWNNLDASHEYSKHEVVYKISPASHLSQSRNLATDSRRQGSLRAGRLRNASKAIYVVGQVTGQGMGASEVC
jgi:hypothetical protein